MANREYPGTSSTSRPDYPAQVVIVQQGSSKEERETVGTFIDGLLKKKEKQNGAPDSSTVDLTFKGSRHDSLIIISLLLIALSQVVGLFMRKSETERGGESKIDLVNIVTITRLLGALEAHEVAWDPRVGQAEVAALNARDAGSAAQTSARDAARDAQSRAQNSTGREYQVLSQALDMLANQAHPQIFVTYPSASPAIIQYGSTPAAQVATGERKIPVLLDLEACFVEPPPGNNSSTNEKSCDVSISKWDEKFLSPPTIIVKLTNNSKYDLEFLDFDAILETVRRSDTGGLRGICSPPRGGYQPWKMGESKANNVVLKLAPIRTSKERKNAKNEWAKGEVYLTLCTTIRLPGSIPILDRSVYHVKLDDKNTGVLDSEPDEREAVLLQ